MGVVCVYVVGVNGRFCVLMDAMGRFEFWSFCVDADDMRVYAVAADGHVSSCSGGVSFLAFRSGLICRVLICCSLLVRF